MIWLLLGLEILLALGLLALAWRGRRATVHGILSEEEAQAEAFLAATVEQLLRDLQESANRTTLRLSTQTEALEALLREADSRVAPERSSARRTRKRARKDEPPAAATPAAWTQQARTLSESGLGPLQIAKEMGRGTEEVRLALAGASKG